MRCIRTLLDEALRLWPKKLTEASDNPITDPFDTGLVPKNAAKQPHLASACDESNMVPADTSASNAMPILKSKTLK